MIDTKYKLDSELLRRSARDASQLLKALANADRLILLCELAHVERNVGELEGLTGIRQPSLSQQLGVLREEGLVETRREGKNIYYRIASPQALAMMRTLYEQYCGKGAS